MEIDLKTIKEIAEWLQEHDYRQVVQYAYNLGSDNGYSEAHGYITKINEDNEDKLLFVDDNPKYTTLELRVNIGRNFLEWILTDYFKGLPDFKYSKKDPCVWVGVNSWNGNIVYQGE